MTKERKILLSYLLKQHIQQAREKPQRRKKVSIGKDIVQIYSKGSHLYLKKIDDTKIALSFDKNFINAPQSLYQLDKLKSQPFYQDVLDWINDEKEINGNKY